MLTFYRRHFLLLELVLAFLFSLGLVLAARVLHFELLQLLHGNRGGVYTALTAVFGALLGFVINGVAVLVAFSESPRLRVLRQSPHFGQVFTVYVSAAKVLGVGSLVAFFGLILDKETAPVPLLAYCNLFFSIAVVLRLYRCIWVLDRVIALVVRG